MAWALTIGLVTGLLLLDFAVAARRPHVVGLAEATAWSSFYIGIAVIFGFVLWWIAGPQTGQQYFGGWLVEKSLSVDNLFVFVIIITRFAVPAEFQQKLLLFGIVAALVMRGAFIAVGAAAIDLFSPTFLLFALDSIPAVFGLTQDPFVVFSANAMALLGLRALYFLIKGLLERLVYLALGARRHPRLHRRQADPCLPARRRVDGSADHSHHGVPGGDPRRTGGDDRGQPPAGTYPPTGAGTHRRPAGTQGPHQVQPPRQRRTTCLSESAAMCSGEIQST